MAAAEVKFQSISEGGRREREQVNTGSMVATITGAGSAVVQWNLP